MGVILGTAFPGLSVLAERLAPTVSEEETRLSIMGGAVLGSSSVAYAVLQFATSAILTLAANTAFADVIGLAVVAGALLRADHSVTLIDQNARLVTEARDPPRPGGRIVDRGRRL